MAEKIVRHGHDVILYDDSVIDHIDSQAFDRERWRDAPAAQGYSGGRGPTLFVELGGKQCVLRHYHRGGFVGRWLDDQFLYLGESRCRPFLEWRLLSQLTDLGLPVPQPVAARLSRRGLIYSADLMTLRLANVVPLSTRLREEPLSDQQWSQVGQMIARFHQAGAYHADLTAHNIQVAADDALYLLDFDRGRLMGESGSWRQRNLDRLKRSLEKISSEGAVPFSDDHWRSLLAGYG